MKLRWIFRPGYVFYFPKFEKKLVITILVQSSGFAQLWNSVLLPIFGSEDKLGRLLYFILSSLENRKCYTVSDSFIQGFGTCKNLLTACLIKYISPSIMANIQYKLVSFHWGYNQLPVFVFVLVSSSGHYI